MTLASLAPSRTSAGTLYAILALAALACNGPTPTPDGSGGATSGSGGADGTGAGSGGDGPGSGGSADGSGGAEESSGGSGSGGRPGNDDDATVGVIQVYRLLAYAPLSGGQVSARFDYVEQAAWDALEAETRTCTSQEFGPCTITSCEDTSVEPDTSDPPSTVRLEAGTITLTPDRDDYTASGTPAGEGNTYTWTGSGSLLGEEVMTVTASGGAIGAFQAMVQVPLAPHLLSHDVAGEESNTVVAIPVSRSVDLTISWNARGTAQSMQTIADRPSGASPMNLNCKFDATVGSGTIPSGALTQLPVGTAIHFVAVNSQKVTTPQGEIELLGFMEMSSPERTGYPKFVLE